MSKTAKQENNAGQPADLPFEEALKRLEGIVEAMESDELPLETMLSRYEEGARLVEHCQTKLSAAEVRIRQVEQRAGGALESRPFAVSQSGVFDEQS